MELFALFLLDRPLALDWLVFVVVEDGLQLFLNKNTYIDDVILIFTRKRATPELQIPEIQMP
jgi:hypothetical protein